MHISHHPSLSVLITGSVVAGVKVLPIDMVNAYILRSIQIYRDDFLSFVTLTFLNKGTSGAMSLA